MILVDHQIHSLCKGKVPKEIRYQFYSHSYYSSSWGDYLCQVKPLVDPFDPSLVNPASLDIRIGKTAKLRREAAKDGYFNIEFSDSVDETYPYWFHPGDRLLVASLETINLPPFLTAQFKLKSSRGREWYGHQFAGFADPGWHGSKLTMELVNNDLAPLPIYPGLRIGQLIFSLTLGIPEKCYAQTGRYNNDQAVHHSKG